MYRCTECGATSETVGQSFDHSLRAHGSAEVLLAEAQMQALREGVARAKSSGNGHDDGLILAALAYGWQPFSIASRLKISEDYVLAVA